MQLKKTIDETTKNEKGIVNSVFYELTFDLRTLNRCGPTQSTGQSQWGKI